MPQSVSIGSPQDRLEERIARCGSPICVGLDPVLERLPAAVRRGSAGDAAAIERFSLDLLDAVEGIAPAVKPQSACFERYGAEGFAALARVIAAARGRFEVILDWKRGDIGISSAHYAAGARALGVDWVTASPYIGLDGLRPFLEEGLGVFALVRTSNPDGDRLQSRELKEGGTLAEAVARLTAEEGSRWMGTNGLSALGAVVGATKAADAARLRSLMPGQIFLVPGYGAQGAGAAEAAACFRADGRGAIVTASRSVIYAYESAAGGGRSGAVASEASEWQGEVRRAAERFATEITGVVRR